TRRSYNRRQEEQARGRTYFRRADAEGPGSSPAARAEGAQKGASMNGHRLRPLAFAFLLAGILAATGFGVSAGLASRKDDIPTLEQKLADCRQEVVYDKEALTYAESFLALAKRDQIVFLGFSSYGPILVTVHAFREALILDYVTGRITKAQFAREL